MNKKLNKCFHRTSYSTMNIRMKKYTSTRNAFMTFFFMFILTNMYSQYVFQVMHCLKNIVASLYHHYGCWSERFGYSIYNDTLRAIDSVALKQQMMI
jgi:hypothetical protein